MSDKDLFKGTRGPINPRVVCVGEAWGREEAAAGKPFVGESGRMLNSMLREAGFDPYDVLFTNLINSRPKNNEMFRFFIPTKEAKKQALYSVKGLYPGSDLLQSLSNLDELIECTAPELIIGCGNYPLWWLSDEECGIGNASGYKVPTGIASWRGSQLYHNSIPFLPIIHPAAILRQYEMRWITVHDLKRGVSKRAEWAEPESNIKILRDFDSVILWLKNTIEEVRRSNSNVYHSLDIETIGSAISCIGFGWSDKDAAVIPMLNLDNKQWVNYWSLEQFITISKLIRKLFSLPNYKIIGQNFLYDLQYLFKTFFSIPNVDYDTMLMQHTMFSQSRKGLHVLSSLYCEHHKYWKDENKVYHEKIGMELERYWLYNGKDCIKTFEVWERLLELLELDDQMPQFEFLMESFWTAFQMMLDGVPVDEKLKSQMARDLIKQIDEVSRFLHRIMPKELLPPVKTKNAAPWFNSPTQLATILYDYLGEPEVLHPQSKRRTANEAALETISNRSPSLKFLCDVILNLRSLQVFHNTFVKAKTDHDGRWRCSYNVGGTNSFRWSSSKNPFGGGLNLQNIPKKKEA